MSLRNRIITLIEQYILTNYSKNDLDEFKGELAESIAENDSDYEMYLIGQYLPNFCNNWPNVKNGNISEPLDVENFEGEFKLDENNIEFIDVLSSGGDWQDPLSFKIYEVKSNTFSLIVSDIQNS